MAAEAADSHKKWAYRVLKFPNIPSIQTDSLRSRQNGGVITVRDIDQRKGIFHWVMVKDNHPPKRPNLAELHYIGSLSRDAEIRRDLSRISKMVRKIMVL